MTKQILLLACLLALRPAFAQLPPPPAGTPTPSGQDFTSRLQNTIRAAASGAPEIALTKFSLDFPGGSPKQLVAAIEKAMGKPLNAIIPPEHADVKLPPVKMSNVDVLQLFKALELASRKTEAYATGNTQYMGGMRSLPSYQQMLTSYGFSTQGQVTDESIWYFYVEKPTTPPTQVQTPPRICRYFSLSPYLDRGQTVDDITTAIQTGWKMLGDDDTPKISFHKETKLLIAVGDPGKLETIDAVLQALKATTSRYTDPATGLPTQLTPMPQRALKSPPSATAVPPGEIPTPEKP